MTRPDHERQALDCFGWLAHWYGTAQLTKHRDGSRTVRGGMLGPYHFSPLTAGQPNAMLGSLEGAMFYPPDPPDTYCPACGGILLYRDADPYPSHCHHCQADFCPRCDAVGVPLTGEGLARSCPACRDAEALAP